MNPDDEVMVEIDGVPVKQSEIDISVLSQQELRKDERYLKILEDKKEAENSLKSELQVVSDYLDNVEGLGELEKQAVMSSLIRLIDNNSSANYLQGWWSGFAYHNFSMEMNSKK